MTSQGKEFLQKFLALIVIVAMLAVMGIPPSVIFFFSVVIYFIWRAIRRTEQQEIVRVFNFYVSASEVLRDEERRWFGFEIAEVIEQGENVLRMMSDPPPLVYFTLGALYHRMGDHEAAAEHLAYVVENDAGEEYNRLKPSPELRRYVQTLRRLEREPGEGPQTLAALRYLGRARRTYADSLLAESRGHLQSKDYAASRTSLPSHPGHGNMPEQIARDAALHSTPPPPISDVLRDVYAEEKKTA